MDFGEFLLAGRRILITGASSGIGRTCAIMAAHLGADVVLTARRADELEATRKMVDEIKSKREISKGSSTPLPSVHRPSSIVVGDLTDPSFVRELVEKAGPCDGLVHAAGVSTLAPAGMISSDMLTKAGRVNCGAFIELMNLFVKRVNCKLSPVDRDACLIRPQSRINATCRCVNDCGPMRTSVPTGDHAHSGGRTAFSAVVVSSVSAAAGWAGGTVYCATKGAVSAAVRALAVELAPQGVRVNAVCPSGIATPLYETQAKMNPEAAAKHIAATQPLGLGKPEQVAAPVCFLLSDAASFITGVNLPVDGGFLAR